MSKTVRIGSRDSVLAIRQASIVMDAVKLSHPEIEFELVLMKTTGDRILDRSLDAIGGKGLFIKELEAALLDGSIDLAVHSYKDMPYEETAGLPIVALSGREAPFDALVLPEGASSIDASKPVGTSSLRRAIQIKKLYGVETESVRGNVTTRLQKLEEGNYSALVLAEAGLIRLGLQQRIHKTFALEEMIPSGSQGILAVQGREGEDYAFLDAFHNREAELVSRAERQYLRSLGGGCSSPTAVYGQLRGKEIVLTGMAVDAENHVETGAVTGGADQGEALGAALAKELLRRLSSEKKDEVVG
jgi:hydroxymethylbilane synthase